MNRITTFCVSPVQELERERQIFALLRAFVVYPKNSFHYCRFCSRQVIVKEWQRGLPHPFTVFISWLIWHPSCANFELRLIKLRVQFATSWLLKSKTGIVQQDCLPVEKRRGSSSRRRSAVQWIWRVLAKPGYFPQRSSLRAYDRRRSFQPKYSGVPKKYSLTEGGKLRR